MKNAVKFFRLSGVVAFALCLMSPFAAQAQYAEPLDDDFDIYDDYYYSQQVSDPFEGFNRGMFTFNEAVDTMLLKPVAQAYVFVVPEFGRDRVSNALTNLGEPVNALNGFLQGEPERGFTSLWRFIINSTLGVAGLFDFAGHNFNLTVKEEDFGQTMGVYGVQSGPYLVLPLIGPSSVRDAFGRVVNWFSNPFNYVDNDAFVYGRVVTSAVDARARNLELIDEIYRTSVDPYATVRSAYTQRREALVRNNEPASGKVGF